LDLGCRFGRTKVNI